MEIEVPPAVVGDAPRVRSYELLVQTRLQEGFERSLFWRLRRELERRADLVVAVYQRAGRTAVEAALSGHDGFVETLLRQHFWMVFEIAGGRVLESFSPGAPAPALEANKGLLASLAAVWIDCCVGKKAERIARTTRKFIVEAIDEGESEGLDTPAIANLIETKAGGPAAAQRAGAIAAHETHGAATAAGDAGAGASGVPVLRQWNARHDGRTRESHLRAHGQRRRQGEPFDIGGVSLMRPGDPAGPPEEVINCRCRITYVLAAHAGAGLPREIVEDLAQRIELLERGARAYVLDNGRQTSNEYMFVYDRRKGELFLVHTSNLPSEVIWPQRLKDAVRDSSNELVVHHNHPGNTSLSGRDLDSHVGSPGLALTVVHAHDGSTYSGAVIDEIKLRETV